MPSCRGIGLAFKHHTTRLHANVHKLSRSRRMDKQGDIAEVMCNYNHKVGFAVLGVHGDSTRDGEGPIATGAGLQALQRPTRCSSCDQGKQQLCSFSLCRVIFAHLRGTQSVDMSVGLRIGLHAWASGLLHALVIPLRRISA